MAKILVVDDEKKIRSLYVKLLADQGYEVCEAVNAVDANDLVVEGGIDLVLLDIKMPEVEGYEMYDVVKMFHKKVKIIVSSVFPLDEQKSMIVGANDYYDKSQGTDVLLKKVTSVLSEDE